MFLCSISNLYFQNTFLFFLIEVLKVQGIMILRPMFLVICILLILLENHVSGSPNGGNCRRDSQCDSGNCCGVWPFKRCRECCKDSDCPSGSNCKYELSIFFLNEIVKKIKIETYINRNRNYILC